MRELLNTLFRYREKQSPDRLGRFPECVDTEAMPERRYLWAARFLVILSAISLSITIMLAATIYLLLPNRGATPRLLHTNQYFSKLERLRSGETTAEAMDLLTEQMIQKYIKLRHEVPKSQFELLKLWGQNSEFAQLSSNYVFGTFSSKASYDQIAKFVDQGLVRQVEFDWVERLTGKLWQVQFRTLNSYKDNPAQTVVIWRAYVRVDYVDLDLERPERWDLNPFGFKVMNYSLAYVGTPEKSEDYLTTAKGVAEQKKE